MDLEMIKTRMAQIEDLEQEVRKAKELLKSELENDEAFQEASQKAKEANQEKKRLRDAVYASNNSQNLIEDIKANSEEINTLREILSPELMEYHTQKKTDEIEDKNGEVRKFKIIVRLEPRKGYDKRDFDGKYTADETK